VVSLVQKCPFITQLDLRVLADELLNIVSRIGSDDKRTQPLKLICEKSIAQLQKLAVRAKCTH
jgi:hypothetical protein